MGVDAGDGPATQTAQFEPALVVAGFACGLALALEAVADHQLDELVVIEALDRSGGDPFAVAQHHDLVGDLEDLVEMMGHVQDGDTAGLRSPDGGEEAFDVGTGQRSGGLVEAVTIDQLRAGDVPGAVLAALQADPSIDYVHFAFDGLTGGVSGVLADAGLAEQVTLVGVDFSAAVLQEIVDGTHKFWTANPKPYSAWLMVDGMARHAIGQENTEERANAILPTFLVSSPEVAEPLIATNGWPGPEGMADQFAALWGVG